MAEEEPLLPAPQLTPLTPPAPPPEPPSAPWRNGAAFWILGLCNNLPYVLMLSAARDLLDPRPGAPVPPGNGSAHNCNPVSTGAVLLADILPTLVIKVTAPFFLHLLPYNVRVVVSALCAWGSFSLVASARGWRPAWGVRVLLASAASGLGEVTLLPLAGSYPGVGVSCWASGTGGAGLGGALGWAGLMGAAPQGPPPFLRWLFLPPLPHSYFFLLLPLPPAPPPPPRTRPSPPPPPQRLTRAQKWAAAKVALPQALPLGLVYFAEYFINQGLLELIYFLLHSEPRPAVPQRSAALPGRRLRLPLCPTAPPRAPHRGPGAAPDFSTYSESMGWPHSASLLLSATPAP
ncbi:unnamed protein product [Bubo scandiacus]